LFRFALDFDDRFDHTRIIREYYVLLVETLDAKHSGLVAELYQAKVLSNEERESVNSEVISFIQNEKLLSMLSRKTNDQFDKFLDALNNTGQRHVRNRITGRPGLLLLDMSLLFCCLPSLFHSDFDDLLDPTSQGLETRTSVLSPVSTTLCNIVSVIADVCRA